MQMDAGLDTGDMLLERVVPIGAETNAAQLHDALAEAGGEAIVAALRALAADGLPARKQPEAGVTYAAKLDKAEAVLDCAQPASLLARRVRAFNPVPGANIRLPGLDEPVKIWRAEAVPRRRARFPAACCAPQPTASTSPPARRAALAGVAEGRQAPAGGCSCGAGSRPEARSRHAPRLRGEPAAQSAGSRQRYRRRTCDGCAPISPGLRGQQIQVGAGQQLRGLHAQAGQQAVRLGHAGFHAFIFPQHHFQFQEFPSPSTRSRWMRVRPAI